jgi:DNA-binding transcriptional LysR family regulator
VAFDDLLDRDFVGLEGHSTLTRLLSARAADGQRPMALRVQVRSFEAVCRAVEAGLGVGVLPLAVAGGFSQAMGLQVVPLADAWAARHMLLVTRGQPPVPTPLATLLAHLEWLAWPGSAPAPDLAPAPR